MEKTLRNFGAFCVLIAMTSVVSIFLETMCFTPENLAWYGSLRMPFITPPMWVCTVVWTILYFMMTCAAWMVWRKRGFFSKALYWYYAQLALNPLACLLLFQHRSFPAAVVGDLVLLFLIAHTISLFYKEDKKAAYLLVPYFLWMCFATNITAMFWYLN